MKLSRRKRRLRTKHQKRNVDVIESRKAEVELEVLRGLRDARSLVAVPADVARCASLRFPAHPFGEPALWESEADADKSKDDTQ